MNYKLSFYRESDVANQDRMFFWVYGCVKIHFLHRFHEL